MQDIEELKALVCEYFSARPRLIGSWKEWLINRGWEEVDVPSPVKWKSEHSDRLYSIREAMHLERELLRLRLVDACGFEEEEYIKGVQKRKKEYKAIKRKVNDS